MRKATEEWLASARDTDPADGDRLSIGDDLTARARPVTRFGTTMTREVLGDELVRELDRLSPDQLKAVHQLISTFKESLVQPTPNQEAVRDGREALSALSEPLSKTIEEERI